LGMGTLLETEEGARHSAVAAIGDVQLLERMAAGERGAFEQLYDRHVRPVHAYALTHLDQREDAEEITQDVFVTLWEKRTSIIILGNSTVPWLLVTCKNKIANRRRALQVRDRRRSGAHVDEFTPSSSPGPEQIAQIRQLHEILQAAVDALSDTDRAVFDACLVDGRSYTDAAALIGVSSGVVRNRLARVRIRLRSELHTLKGTS
jgi:RNA polymerase sigma factor (sigma-70 family)